MHQRRHDIVDSCKTVWGRCLVTGQADNAMHASAQNGACLDSNSLGDPVMKSQWVKSTISRWPELISNFEDFDKLYKRSVHNLMNKISDHSGNPAFSHVTHIVCCGCDVLNWPVERLGFGESPFQLHNDDDDGYPRQHFRLSICFYFGWAWQILRRAGLSSGVWWRAKF